MYIIGPYGWPDYFVNVHEYATWKRGGRDEVGKR